jgi:uncharacterized protein YcbX
MIVDEHGMFVAQRSVGGLGIAIPAMCLIEPRIGDGTLELAAPGMPGLALPIDGGGSVRDAQIWRRRRPVIDQGDEAAEWCTAFLARARQGRYRLVRVSDDDPAAPGFADTAPVLVISRASLDALNRRLATPVGMDRFRPNVVLEGGNAHVEDGLDRLRFGTVELVGAGLCVRCSMPTIDQRSAAPGKEPIRTLATYRTADGGIVFGRHFAPSASGTISVGDRVARA